MIYREHYISQVREFYDSDLIKSVDTRVDIETPENEKIRAQLTDEIVEQIRLSVNKSLDKVKNNK